MTHFTTTQPRFLPETRMSAEDPAARAGALPAGAPLFMEGDTVDRFYELASGVVRLSKTLPDGRRQVLGFLYPGEIFTPSGFAFHAADEATCTADAVTSVTVVSHRLSAVSAMLANRPELTRELLAAAGRSLARVQEQMLLLGRMAAMERLAWFLLGMAEQQGGAGDGKLRLPMARADIADYLGLTVETISRILGQLRARRVIALDGPATIRLLDRATLREMAEGTYDGPAHGHVAAGAMRGAGRRTEQAVRIH